MKHLTELGFYITPYEAFKYCAECDKICTMRCDIMKKAQVRYEEEHNGEGQRGAAPGTEEV